MLLFACPIWIQEVGNSNCWFLSKFPAKTFTLLFEWRQKVEKMVAKFLLPLYQPSSSPAAITHFYFLLPVLFSDMRILRMPPLLARFYSAAAAFQLGNLCPVSDETPALETANYKCCHHFCFCSPNFQKEDLEMPVMNMSNSPKSALLSCFENRYHHLR